jgi:hypothetical protein
LVPAEEAVVFLLGSFAPVNEAVVEELGFGLGGAAEFPGEEREAVEEEVVERAGGLELVAEVGDEAGVVVAFGFGDEGGLVEAGAQAVGEGVM